jgi:hypothetical protein
MERTHIFKKLWFINCDNDEGWPIDVNEQQYFIYTLTPRYCFNFIIIQNSIYRQTQNLQVKLLHLANLISYLVYTKFLGDEFIRVFEDREFILFTTLSG